MASCTTNGIQVSVKTKYHPEHSDRSAPKFTFSYRIHIHNKSRRRVQLLKRKWSIFDSFGVIREVEGDGVIGEQPMLNSGETHEYGSWCQLSADMGRMRGTYLMVDMATQERFEIKIPPFNLTADYRKN